MASKNQFDLLVDVDNDDPSHLIAAAEKKAAAAPAAPAKLPTKQPPPPPVQAVREAKNFAAPTRDGAGRGGPGRGRGGRGGRTGPRRHFGDSDANGFEGGYGGGGFGNVVVRGEEGEGKGSERGRGPRLPYRGGGRRGGFSGGEPGDETGRPTRRTYERRSGTGRGYEMKREGAGRGNWGTVTDEGLEQEAVEAVSTEPAAVIEDEKKPEDVPESEVEKNKEGAANEEEEEQGQEPEDKEMTLEEYEKVLDERRKALLALKGEERKVEVDKELKSMQQLSVKKGTDEVFIKLGSDKDSKKKENAERDERAKKSLSINEFLKPSEGERFYGPSGRGRGGRGRGRGERGGFHGGYGGSSRGPAAAPAIEDQAQFPTLGGK